MKFHFFLSNRTPLDIAIVKDNIEMVKLLLACPTINVNEYSISNTIYFLIKFEIVFICSF